MMAIPAWRGLLAASAFVSICACGLHAPSALAEDPPKPREWKLSVAVGPAFALGKAAEIWAKRIAEHSGGTMVVTLHPGASLANRDPEREFGALRDGAADLAVGSTLAWSAQVDALAVVGLPWLAPDSRRLAQLATGDVRDRLFAAVDKAGAVAVALAPLGHRALATAGKAVRTPDGLQGLGVRIAASRYLADFYAGLGARPQTMPFADAAAAFRAGTLDAQEGPVAAMVATRVAALGLRHVALWGAIAELAVFAVSRAAWDGWSAEQRDWVAAAARETALELAGTAGREEQDALVVLRDRGVELLRPTASGIAAFAVAARPVYDRWAAIAGAGLVGAAEGAVAAAPPP
jgi:TRAP-type C4-dicarboxylate transport system substrate-binding protein